jgi:hypothetical protein
MYRHKSEVIETAGLPVAGGIITLMMTENCLTT